MPFVKLDCRILDSTLWMDREARDLFITALLMAIPTAFDEPQPTLKVDSLEENDWDLPPGEYGLVDAAGTAIIQRALMDIEVGMDALKRLTAPEAISRTASFDGRRLARIDGGFVVLNFRKYRDKDHTAAERQKRYRERKKSRDKKERNAQRGRRYAVTDPNVTEAEAEAEAENTNSPSGSVPYQSIVDLYHEHCPMLPRVKVLSKKRKSALSSRWKTFAVDRGQGDKAEKIRFNTLEAWMRYFKFIAKNCPFMHGKNDQGWTANFDFCIRESAMVNVMENKYVDRGKNR